MSWNIKTPGDFINGPLTVAGAATFNSNVAIAGNLAVDTNVLFVDSTLNRVGVNTSSPGQALDIVGGIRTSSFWILDGSPFGAGASVRYISGGATATNWYQNCPTGGTHYWAFNEVIAMTLNANGLGIGGRIPAASGQGLAFPITQSASTDPNTLDDYEEGTFTPTIVGTTVAGTGTYTTQLGRYTKVGRIVTCDISLVWTAHTGTGALEIDGLPFSVLNTTGYAASAVIGYIDNIALTAGNIPIAVLWWFNTTKIRFNQTPTGGGAATGVSMDAAGQINLSITYIVA